MSNTETDPATDTDEKSTATIDPEHFGKSPIQWPGGKRRLSNDILSMLPPVERIGRFHEPFVGGGALFFRLVGGEGVTPGTINDLNTRLVNFYRQVRDHPEEVIEFLKSFDRPHADPDFDMPYATETQRGKPIDRYYHQQRARFNERVHGNPFDPVEEAALLVYLNLTGFNGRFSENSMGEFNNSIGFSSLEHDVRWVRPGRIRAASQALAQTPVYNQDFEYIFEVVAKRDVVYLDPPYEPRSTVGNFREYTKNGFDLDDQMRVVRLAQELDRRGIHVVVSNSGVMEPIYERAGFDVFMVDTNYSIGGHADRHPDVEEIIATNVPADERAGSVGGE